MTTRQRNKLLVRNAIERVEFHVRGLYSLADAEVRVISFKLKNGIVSATLAVRTNGVEDIIEGAYPLTGLQQWTACLLDHRFV